MATTSTLQLTLLMLSTNLCLAVWQNMTVMEGSTITLKCRLVSGDDIHTEWKNPQGNIMFYNRYKGVRDKRYSIKRLSSTMFKISVSKVTFKDGGNYICSQYGHTVMKKTVSVTVLGQPIVKVLRHNRGVKCTAASTHFAQQISWQFGDGIEIDAPPHDIYEDGIKAYFTEDTVMQPLKRERICCIVRHPLTSKPLKKCIIVGPAYEPRGSTDKPMAPNSIKASPEATNLEATTRNRTSTAIRLDTMTTTSDQTTFTRSPSDQSQEPTDLWRGATNETWHAERVNSTEVQTLSSTTPETLVSTGVHPNTTMTSDQTTFTRSPSDQSQEPTDLWRGATNETWHAERVNSTEVQTLSSTTPETLVSTGVHPNTSDTKLTDRNITQDTSQNSTEGNSGRIVLPRNAGILIFLVTCLIASLSVVVVFLAMKLRRDHIHWKRENEDSEQSTESNKSKSSDKKRQWPGQKCRGIFKIVFTKYATEEPTVISTAPTTVAEPTEQFPEIHVSSHEDDRAPVKETEL
ncbi:hypothetical protein CRUP_026011 [Coryphaenoides rupestris]|nr:hypothetical protein CRUP_026011 [Coryphaenoides rupestris]